MSDMSQSIGQVVSGQSQALERTTQKQCGACFVTAWVISVVVGMIVLDVIMFLALT